MNRKEIILFLKELKNTTQDKYHIKSIGLFGSMARQNTKDEPGDIDIVVEPESLHPRRIQGLPARQVSSRGEQARTGRSVE